MLEKINKQVVSILMKGHIPISDASEVKEAEDPQKSDFSKYKTGRSDLNEGSSSGSSSNNKEKQKVQPIRVEKKVGRNDPCPCGSGKKYKNCHGRATQPAQ